MLTFYWSLQLENEKCRIGADEDISIFKHPLYSSKRRVGSSNPDVQYVMNNLLIDFFNICYVGVLLKFKRLKFLRLKQRLSALFRFGAKLWVDKRELLLKFIWSVTILNHNLWLFDKKHTQNATSLRATFRFHIQD